MEVEKTTYGDWLRQQRKKRRPLLTQERLSDAAGFDRTYVNKIETGKIGLPTYETRQRFHEVLGTSEDELKALGIVPTLTARLSMSDVPTATGIETATVQMIDPMPDAIRRWVAAMTDHERRLMWEYLKPYILVDHLDDARAEDDEEAAGQRRR